MLPNKCHPLCLSLCVLCLLVAGVAGCDVGTGADGGQSPVAFVASVSPVNPADTRVGELTTANLASMGVFGYYTRGNAWSVMADVSIPDFMNNERVAKSGSAWTYSPVKYWPNTAGDKLTFFAYAPHASDTYKPATGEGVYSVISGVGTLKIFYRTPAQEEEQFDLLAAMGLIDCTRGTRLTFTMQHMLTKVEFRVKSSSDITVGGLSLPNINEVVVVGFDKATGEPQVSVPARDPSDPQVDAVACLNYGSIDVPASTNPAVPGTTVATFYLPPEKPAKVLFDYTDNGSLTETEFDLPGGDLWKSGKHVVYTILVDGGAKISVTSAGIGLDWPSTPTDRGDEEASAL